jgi:outer membrane protein, heavy metal efflux system
MRGARLGRLPLGLVALGLAGGLPAGGCAPSRAQLFDPVGGAIHARVGASPVWERGARRSPAVERRIGEILAEPLTADSAAELAVLGSPVLQARFEELAIAGAALTTATLPPRPQLQLQYRFAVDEGEQQVELSLVQDVTELLALVHGGRAAGAELRAARQRAVAAAIDLGARARGAFYGVVVAERRLALRRGAHEAAAAAAELARGLRASGHIIELSLTRELVLEQEASLGVRQGEAELEVARARLLAILGIEDGTPFRVASQLPALPEEAPELADLDEASIAASLHLRAVRWQIVAAGQQVGAARLRGLLPGVLVGVSAKREDGWGVGPIVGLSVPLWNRGQGTRVRAWAELRRLQHEHAALTLQVRAAAQAARARLESAHDRAATLRDHVVPLRERLLQEALLQYNAMNLSPFELLVIRRGMFEAEERLLDATRDFWLAQTQVETLRAGSFSRAGGAEAEVHLSDRSDDR